MHRDDWVPSRHRPAEEAVQLDGTVSRDHYWWLAYDWENLYLVCPACRSNKGRLFPTHSSRMRPENRDWTDFMLEQPLLIDPCVNDPIDDLGYQHEGMLLGLTPRGKTTIDVLGLNRPDLVEARAASVREAWEAIDRLPVSKRHGTLPASITKLVADRKPYLGIRRWALENHDRDGIRPAQVPANAQEVVAACSESTSLSGCLGRGPRTPRQASSAGGCPCPAPPPCSPQRWHQSSGSGTRQASTA